MASRSFSHQLSRLERAAAAGLYQAGNRILNRSQELVPVDTGTLKGSGRVLEPQISHGQVTVVVGYGYGSETNPRTGQEALAYAIAVHERTDVYHPTGQAKFLELSALEELASLGPDVRASIQRARVLGEGVEREIEFFPEVL